MKNLFYLTFIITAISLISCSDTLTEQSTDVDNTELSLRTNSECPGQAFQVQHTGDQCSGGTFPCEYSGTWVRMRTSQVNINKVVITPFDGTAGTDCATQISLPVVNGEVEFCLPGGSNTVFHLAYAGGCQIVEP